MSFLLCSLHSYLSKRDTFEIVRHETEQLWQMSQFTDSSLRKPTKCLILKTVFCRLAHLYTQMLNSTLQRAAMCITSCTPSPFSLGNCAPHLQLREESLSRRFLRWLSSTLLNEKTVFSASKTHVRHTCICLYGGKVFNIFRARSIDVTNRLWIASHIRWYLSS